MSCLLTHSGDQWAHQRYIYAYTLRTSARMIPIPPVQFSQDPNRGIDAALSRLVFEEGLPLSFLESPSFRRFVELLAPNEPKACIWSFIFVGWDIVISIRSCFLSRFFLIKLNPWKKWKFCASHEPSTAFILCPI